jgi:hypothetical protein
MLIKNIIVAYFNDVCQDSRKRLQLSAYPRLGLSSDRELGYPKSLPNKNEHVRTKTETNELKVAQFAL